MLKSWPKIRRDTHGRRPAYFRSAEVVKVCTRGLYLSSFIETMWSFFHWRRGHNHRFVVQKFVVLYGSSSSATVVRDFLIHVSNSRTYSSNGMPFLSLGCQKRHSQKAEFYLLVSTLLQLCNNGLSTMLYVQAQLTMMGQ